MGAEEQDLWTVELSQVKWMISQCLTPTPPPVRHHLGMFSYVQLAVRGLLMTGWVYPRDPRESEKPRDGRRRELAEDRR